MDASSFAVTATPLAQGGFALALLLSLGLGFLLGRRTGDVARRIRGLDEQVESLAQDKERLEGEIQAFRGRVTDHFAGTSERLRDLALQYRTVYDHLAEGARDLCPEGFLELEGQIEMDRLQAGAGLEQPLPGEASVEGAPDAAAEPVSAGDHSEHSPDEAVRPL